MGNGSNYKLKNQIDSPSDLMEYLHRKVLAHNTYRVYTNAGYFNSWVKEDGLFLSDGAKWNDVQDRDLFRNSDEEKRFGICFTFSISENVAMWMLYGGMEHRGIVVPFKRSEINRIRESNTIQLGSWEGNVFKPYKNLSAEDGDFRFELVDMIYYGDGKDGDCYDIKQSDERVNGVPKSLIDSIEFAKKAYPWAYENECRFIVHVKRSAIEGYNGNTVRIPLYGLYTEISQRVVCSPNYDGEPIFLSSNLKGKIDWDLCRNCDNKTILLCS